MSNANNYKYLRCRVADTEHRALKVEAARRGVTVQDLLAVEVAGLIKRLTRRPATDCGDAPAAVATGAGE